MHTLEMTNTTLCLESQSIMFNVSEVFALFMLKMHNTASQNQLLDIINYSEYMYHYLIYQSFAFF